VVRLADKGVRRLARARLAPQAKWSPDGRLLAFTDANCLMAVPANGGPVREVTCASASPLPGPGKFPGMLANYLWFNNINPSWSPDGERLAWTVPVPEEERVELWIVDSASGRHQVAWAGERKYASIPRGPLWSPDGKRIAFTMNWYRQDEIWVLRNLLRRPGHAG
jgi:Tol biopolymer transport system component